MTHSLFGLALGLLGLLAVLWRIATDKSVDLVGQLKPSTREILHGWQEQRPKTSNREGKGH